MTAQHYYTNNNPYIFPLHSNNNTNTGQWEDVVQKGDSVLLILRGVPLEEEKNLPVNTHKLQPPFHKADDIPGDILLQVSLCLDLGSYISILVVSYFMWSGALDSSHVLLSYFITPPV